MSETLTIMIRVAVVTVAALLPLINPAGTAPIFLSLTTGESDRTRATMAVRIARNAALLLAAATLGGSSILLFFGLSLAEIRIAGGLLVIATAWQLMHTDQRPDAAITALSRRDAKDLTHAAFYPLTFPVTIGPGSLAIAVTLGAGAGDTTRMAALPGAIAGIVIVSFTIYLCYRFAARAARVLGDAGTLVLFRLSAFILLAVGVKILADGLAERITAG
ncbi:MAG TPA: MarC family protein [Vicinamibacterales bacterium]|jgi:multiple antibiotic resistance protein|nr:MarC family protein [Vicinamibacterales bacterium]